MMRNSLVLALGFLKGLRYALPLPLFTKCMINFTQAHYLFAAAAMLEELSDLVNSEAPATGGGEPEPGQDEMVAVKNSPKEVAGPEEAEAPLTEAAAPEPKPALQAEPVPLAAAAAAEEPPAGMPAAAAQEQGGA